MEKPSIIQHSKLKIENYYGFTLVEILLAIFIFAVVVTTIFGSYNFLSAKSGAGSENIAPFEMAQNCLNRITVDLQSLYLSTPPMYSPPDFNDPPDPYRLVGDTAFEGNNSFSRLRFTSLAHLPMGKNNDKGIAEIVYYVQATEDKNFVLKRSDRLSVFEQSEKKRDPVLCEKVKSLTLKYYDQEGREYDRWNSDSKDFGYATPVAINIKLELGDDSSAMVFETRVTLPVTRAAGT